MRSRLALGLVCVMAFGLAMEAQTVYGIKGGCDLPRLYYSNPHLRDLPHVFLIGPSGGAFVEFPVWEQLALAPELNYQFRGGATSYPYLNDTVSYSLVANHVNLRIPVCYYLTRDEVFKPYVVAGLEGGYALNGLITLRQPGLPIPSKQVPINRSNYSRLQFNALAGAGIRLDLNMPRVILVIKLDAAVNWGFTDTFSKDEKQELSHPTNVYAYNHQGVRLSRGLEAHLGLGLIFKGGLKDACGNFQNNYKRKKVSYVW